jgi:DNA-binding MarR family transcriptional regulator
MTDGPPLARLFAIAYRRMVDDLHVQLRDRGWSDVRPSYGFVLLAVRDEPRTTTELASLLGVTKQAASKLVDAMAIGGYVERTVGPEDLRRRPVALTRRGRQLLDAVEEIYDDLEGTWAEVIGERSVARLRQDLTRVLASPADGRLPPVRPTL